MSSEEIVGRLTDASWQLAIGGAAVWLLGLRLPGNVRAWLWRLVALKAFVSLLFIAPLPWLAPEPTPSLAFTPRIDSMSAIPTGPVAPTPLAAEVVVLWLWALLALAAFAVLAWRVLGAERTVRAVSTAAAVERVEGCQVVRSDLAKTPLIIGLTRPTILLPAEGDTALPLAHELAHAQRRDLMWDVIVCGFRAAFWFHPLAWLAAKEHRQACEEASDALAIQRTGASPSEYAGALLVYASRARLPIAGLASSASDLKRRIYQMHRHRLHPAAIAAISIASLSLLIPARLVARQAESAIPAATSIDQKGSEILLLPYVSKRVGVTAEQSSQIVKLWDGSAEKYRGIGRAIADMKAKGRPVTERVKYETLKKDQLNATLTKEILSKLTIPQRAKLRRVVLDHVGPLALADKEVGEEIGLSAAKIARIKAIEAEAQREFMKNSIQEAHENLERLRKGVNLPPEKRSRYLELTGKGERFANTPEFKKYRETFKLADGDPRKIAAKAAFAKWMETNPPRPTPEESQELIELTKEAGSDPTRKEMRERYLQL